MATYQIHEKDETDGWKTVKESSDLNDPMFTKDDRWFFNWITERGVGTYATVGWTMYTIDTSR